MNFGFDIVDKRAAISPDRVAICWHYSAGKTLEISNDDLRHHSDVCAYYLHKLGVGQGSVVALCSLDKGFEFAIVLTAISKLGAVAMFIDEKNDIISSLNEEKAYATICHNRAEEIKIIDNNLSSLHTLEVKISFGTPYPCGWFDLHTGMRLAGIFKPAKIDIANYTSLILRGKSHRLAYDNTYPFTTDNDRIWDIFYRKMREGEVFEL